MLRPPGPVGLGAGLRDWGAWPKVPARGCLSGCGGQTMRGLTSPRELGRDPGPLGPCTGCFGLILWGQLRPDPSPTLKVAEDLGREDCPLHSQGPRVQSRQGD